MSTSRTAVAPTRASLARARRRHRWSAVLIALLVLLGSATMLYPAAASWFADRIQAAAGDRYTEAVSALAPEDRADRLADAEEYNDLLRGGAIPDPFGAITEETVVDADDPYWSLLDAGDGTMARIRIPSIDVDLPIYHGTAADVLRQGVGHLQGTSLPIGGAGSHTVLTGHRGLTEATLFTRLDEMDDGDVIEIDVYGETLAYRVTEVQVVLPTDVDALRPVAGSDLLTLVTCTPLGVNSHRILVTAERIDATEIPEVVTPDAWPVPWWLVAYCAVLVGTTGYLASAMRRR
ncbi:class C sortase [Microbacterium sp. NPDC055683]